MELEEYSMYSVYSTSNSGVAGIVVKDFNDFARSCGPGLAFSQTSERLQRRLMILDFYFCSI